MERFERFGSLSYAIVVKYTKPNKMQITINGQWHDDQRLHFQVQMWYKMRLKTPNGNQYRIFINNQWSNNDNKKKKKLRF